MEEQTQKARWSRRIDDYGKRHWKPEKPYRKYRGEAIAAIIFNLIWLWIINKVPDWNFSFVLDSYGVLLWIWNLNVGVQVLTNLIILIFAVRWLRYLMKAVMEAGSFVSLIATYYLYPFNFSDAVGWSHTDTVIQIALIIAMIVTAIQILVDVLKIFFGRS
jgi:hypothetical protein